MNLNELSKRVHEGNKKWWTDINTGLPIERNKGELLMLVITELAEAVEGIRKNLMDDKIPHRKMEEVEMADAFIRLMDYAGGFKIKIKIPDTQFFYDKDGNKAEAMMNIVASIIHAHHFGESQIGFPIQEIINYCSSHNLDLEGAIEEKLAYNATRIDHTHEHRKSENGKKF